MGINELIKIGSRIKSYRKDSGMSQREMADKLGLSYSTYSNYENNYREPPAEIISRICDILKVDLPDLVGVGEMNFSTIDAIIWKIQNLGYEINGDESEGYIWIEFPDGSFEIAYNDLLSLDKETDAFLRFKLEELKEKNIKDFRLRK